MKKLLIIGLFTVFLIGLQSARGQELVVTTYDGQDRVVKVDTFLLGDYIVVKHAKKGRNPHHFQGKITGIFKDRGVVRIFDYARSTRVMPLVGKKIAVDEIIAVMRLDKEKFKARESRAVGLRAAQVLGAAIGGHAGDAVLYGSVGGDVVSDFLSREELDTERVKCEIIE